MRDRLAQLRVASGAVLILLALGPAVMAQQQQSQRTAGNPAAGGNTNQASAETETIHGLIAAITVEGEAMLDYRTNRAVAAEATYLTVVGSPAMHHASGHDPAEAGRRNAADPNRRDPAPGALASAARHRHNVYHIYLTPKTKICEDWSDRGRVVPASDTPSSAQKKEVTVDNLEVGDRVEIQFMRNESWSASHPARQTDQMARKHGRHRTFYGEATAVTILAGRDMSSHSAATSSTTERRP